MSKKAPRAQENESARDVPTPRDLMALLTELGIDYAYHEHEAVYTVEESSKIEQDIPGAHCRNLYLRDKKKRNFLVTAMNETPVDLKALEKEIGCARLSFGSADRLWQFLGVKPGSVCPFAVINDPNQDVQVILDKHMMEQDRVNYHPLENTMTIGVTPDGLLKFLEHTGHTPRILDLAKISPTS